MRLSAITRHPVKSLQGEQLTSAVVESDGLAGDRRWGILDETTGRVLTARRAPELLFASASLASDGTPVITLPTGEICAGPGTETDAALSRWLGRPVQLVRSVGQPGARAEFFADPTDDTSDAIEWTMPSGRFVDALPLLVLTTASLRAGAALHSAGEWHPRRFRPNLVLEADGEGWAEDGWYGTSDLCVGDVRLRPQEGCVRCTMVTRPQPGLGEDRDIFRTLARHHGALFGAWSTVVSGGTISIGDVVDLQPQTSPAADGGAHVIAQRRSQDDVDTVESV
ncbi:MAG TPA: MOSC N-terminal beta barrel domain-containing protein [Mycobacteriales bacterium]|nr:MOSC N-terminal beta barrel domain-containing protein [Mycobacteriales bacterium]